MRVGGRAARRLFAGGADEAFLRRNRAICAFLQRAGTAQPRETFRAALSAEQCAYVEQLHKTYFEDASAEARDQLVSLLCLRAAPAFARRDFFLPLGLREEQLAEVGEAQLERHFDEQKAFAAAVGAELKETVRSAPAPTAAAEAPAAPVEDPKTKRYKVELTGIDAAKKLSIIKELKALLGLGLKDAKDAAEKLPRTLKADLGHEEMEALRARLTAVGCVLTVS